MASGFYFKSSKKIAMFVFLSVLFSKCRHSKGDMCNAAIDIDMNYTCHANKEGIFNIIVNSYNYNISVDQSLGVPKSISNVNNSPEYDTFEYIRLTGFPVRGESYGRIRAHVCLFLSSKDILSADSIEVKFFAINGHEIHVATYQLPSNYNTNYTMPSILRWDCYWGIPILLPDDEKTIQVEVTSFKVNKRKSQSVFRFRFPYWIHYNNRQFNPCDFEPFVYCTLDHQVFITSENCSKHNSIEIFIAYEESNSGEVIEQIKNVTFNQPNNYSNFSFSKNDSHNYYYWGKYYNASLDINYTDDNVNSYENRNLSNLADNSEINRLWYTLTPCVIIIVIILSSITYLSRHYIKLIVNHARTINLRKNGYTRIKPKLLFLYCQCQNHEMYWKQLEPFLHFLENYCYVTILESPVSNPHEVKIPLEDSSQVLDYLVIAPMPNKVNHDREGRKKIKEIQGKMISIEEKKRIILKFPFCENESGCETFGSRNTISFQMMNEFLAFLKYVHKKKSFITRSRLSESQILEIEGKLNKYHWTKNGFITYETIIPNQTNVECQILKSEANGNFPNLQDMVL